MENTYIFTKGIGGTATLVCIIHHEYRNSIYNLKVIGVTYPLRSLIINYQFHVSRGKERTISLTSKELNDEE